MQKGACGRPEISETGGKVTRNAPVRASGRGRRPNPQNQNQGSGPESERGEKQARGCRGQRAGPGIRNRGMAPRAIGEGGPHSRGRRGRLDPREEGGGPASRWGPRGGGARKDPGGPCCASPGISVLSPRGRLIPHPQNTLSPHAAATRPPPAYPRPWRCSRDPSVPPARLRAHRACALRSCLLSSAEAAAASPFRSHGVSNRSPLPRQPPFPPFRSSRPSRPSLGGGGTRERGITVAQAQKESSGVGVRPSMRTRPPGTRRKVLSSVEFWRLKMARIRLGLCTNPQRGCMSFLFLSWNDSVCARLVTRITPPESVLMCKGWGVSSCTCALTLRRVQA